MAKIVRIFTLTAVMALAGEARAASAPQSLPEFNPPSPQQIIRMSLPTIKNGPIPQAVSSQPIATFTGNYSANVQSPLEADGVRAMAEWNAENECYRTGYFCRGNSVSEIRCLRGYCTATATAFEVLNYGGPFYAFQSLIQIDAHSDIDYDSLEKYGAFWRAIHNAHDKCKAAGHQSCASVIHSLDCKPISSFMWHCDVGGYAWSFY